MMDAKFEGQIENPTNKGGACEEINGGSPLEGAKGHFRSIHPSIQFFFSNSLQTF